MYTCLTRYTYTSQVVVADGHTYERGKIEEWIKREQAHGREVRSPVTNEPLANTHLIPNHTLRSAIRESVEKAARDSSEAVLKRKRVVPSSQFS
jgi:hypothetical protein